ncbi:response regulator [Dyadobacter aurulentus]|uniref:response regulator n=1 Tax=Dyadobacter sp. UC 10 TaxID=2605428 RepID=UPI0011F3FA4C|nr:response regulator [Dyadobacter sp. UC 10]KAA0993703.1 response regulator [Dyadobacter sp. UC 10]
MKKAVRILIVEDEGIQAISLEETLEQAGYEVAGIADSGEEVLRFVQESQVDLIIMDIHIKGDLDGIETAHKVKEVRSLMPIIYLTAYMDQETVRRAGETSPAGYITKPYRQLHLLNCIEEAVKDSEETK